MDIEELSDAHESAYLNWINDYVATEPGGFERFHAGSSTGVTSAAFKKFVKTAEAERLDWRPKAKKTSLSRYVMRAPGGEIVACGLLRFPLDEKTEKVGGNLEVFVAPQFRKRGVGSLCLSRLLFEAVRAGLRRALVTCPATDLAARKMIERNRGELEDIAGKKGSEIARYWIRFS